ncbi:MAG TPA: hypothetical protein VFC54_10925 [Pseudolabrys sp.]|nr:hypothetical protein [Pseudolabrys sp.]
MKRTSTGRLFAVTIGGALAAALFCSAAGAQNIGHGKHHPAKASNTEDAAKKKATDEAYQKALKGIPDATRKTDPWGSMR